MKVLLNEDKVRGKYDLSVFLVYIPTWFESQWNVRVPSQWKDISNQLYHTLWQLFPIPISCKLSWNCKPQLLREAIYFPCTTQILQKKLEIQTRGENVLESHSRCC